jgi:hypothetical protein
VNPVADATNTSSFTMPFTRSSVPSAAWSAASAWSAHRRAPALASSMVTFSPTLPATVTAPSCIGICAATHARSPTTFTGM